MAVVVSPAPLDVLREYLEALDVSPVVRGWIGQLLEPDTLNLLRAGGDRQVDVRLSASGGRVRRRPVVAFDAGPQEFVAP